MLKLPPGNFIARTVYATALVASVALALTGHATPGEALGCIVTLLAAYEQRAQTAA